MGKKFPATVKYHSDWHLYASDDAGHTWTDGAIQIILLQEIRDELKRLNTLLHCQNFQQIPKSLRELNRRLARTHPLKGQPSIKS